MGQPVARPALSSTSTSPAAMNPPVNRKHCAASGPASSRGFQGVHGEIVAPDSRETSPSPSTQLWRVGRISASLDPSGGPPRRVFRDLEERDEAAAKTLLAATWFPPSELLASPEGGRRQRVVLELGRTVVGVAVRTGAAGSRM